MTFAYFWDTINIQRNKKNECKTDQILDSLSSLLLPKSILKKKKTNVSYSGKNDLLVVIFGSSITQLVFCHPFNALYTMSLALHIINNRKASTFIFSHLSPI